MERLRRRFGVVFEGIEKPSVDEGAPEGWTSHDLVDILAVARTDVDHVLYGLVKELSSLSLRRTTRARGTLTPPAKIGQP